MPISETVPGPYQEQTSDPSCFFIPYWVHNALLRNNYDIMTVLQYNKLRSVMSVEDLAELCYCQFFDKSTILSLFNSLSLPYSTQWRDQMSEEQEREYNLSVQPLSFTSPIKQSVTEKLLDENIPNTEQSYHNVIVAGNGTFFVVMKKGFMSAIACPFYQKSLITEVLKVLYMTLPLDRVSRLEIFEKYLSFLPPPTQ
jgi:hypothetical protein